MSLQVGAGRMRKAPHEETPRACRRPPRTGPARSGAGPHPVTMNPITASRPRPQAQATNPSLPLPRTEVLRTERAPQKLLERRERPTNLPGSADTFEPARTTAPKAAAPTLEELKAMSPEERAEYRASLDQQAAGHAAARAELKKKMGESEQSLAATRNLIELLGPWTR